MEQVETRIVNDGHLSAIAYYLMSEVKETGLGEKFKKLVPSMAFACFALESRLTTLGGEVFEGSEFKKYTNATLIGKFDWLLSRMGIKDEELSQIQQMRDTIAEMVNFRNSVVHSKVISLTEERELIGLEQFDDRFILPSKSEKDFMTMYSEDKADSYLRVLTKLDYLWIVLNKRYFPAGIPVLVYSTSTAKKVVP